MKIICCLLFFIILNVRAENPECRQASFENDELGIALLHFTSLEGRYRIGSCFVEIKYCHKDQNENSGKSSFVGDVFIVDSDGNERYIPIYYAKSKTKKAHGVLKRTARTFIYRFKDKNYDDQSGDYEWFDLEIVKKVNLTEIDYIEVGYSSQVERRERTSKKWIVCGEEREEYVKNHPIKYRYRSWWWWLTHI